MEGAPPPPPPTPPSPLPSPTPGSAEKSSGGATTPPPTPTPPPSPLSQPPSSEEDAVTRMLAQLERLEFYHGAIIEEDVSSLIKRHGDFIMWMRVNNDGKKEVVLTILWNSAHHHLPMNAKAIGPDALAYSFDYTTIANDPAQLVKKHVMGIPVTPPGSPTFFLLNPIPKSSWELTREMITVERKLGEGAFGEIHAGILRTRKNRLVKVAVKMTKLSGDNEKATTELQKEAAIMRQYQHKNIVAFYGMVIERSSVMVVMELVDGGSLDVFLKLNPTTALADRGLFTHDLALGLAYLHSKNCLHRDIALRNTLLDKTRMMAKISDFGLSRKADSVKLTNKEKIPIRWTAPEVLQTLVYTRAADTFAFGILIWEIYSNAAIPYGDQSNAQIKAGIIHEYYRPAFASGTPDEIVTAAVDCWKGSPASRPQLSAIVERLKHYARKPPKDETKENINTKTCDDDGDLMHDDKAAKGSEAKDKARNFSREKVPPQSAKKNHSKEAIPQQSNRRPSREKVSQNHSKEAIPQQSNRRPSREKVSTTTTTTTTTSAESTRRTAPSSQIRRMESGRRKKTAASPQQRRMESGRRQGRSQARTASAEKLSKPPASR